MVPEERLRVGSVPIGSPDVEITKAPTRKARRSSSSTRSAFARTPNSVNTRASRSRRPAPRCPTRSSTARSTACARAWLSLDVVDRAAEEGDHVLVDFVGSLDGVEFEGGSANDHTIEIGSGQLIDDFEEQIIGAKAGDEVAVNELPRGVRAAELAGQNADFKVTAGRSPGEAVDARGR